MFELTKSIVLDDINLPLEAKKIELNWVSLSHLACEIPNEYLGYWGKKGTVKGFWLGKYLITEAQWKALSKIFFQESITTKQLNYPATGIKWLTIMKYCSLLTQYYSKQLPPGYHFTLPTEGYWIYACQDINKEEELKVDFAEVGSKTFNRFGLYDMLGNVPQWCYDMFVAYPLYGVDYIGNQELGEDAREYDGDDLRLVVNDYTDYNPEGRGYYSFNVGKENFTGKKDIGFRLCLRPFTHWDLNDGTLIHHKINII